MVIQVSKIYFSHTFGLPPQFLAHSSPNTRNFPSVAFKVSFVMLMSGFLPVGEPVKPILWSEGGNFQSRPTSGGGEELEGASITNGKWFNQSRLCNEASIKIQKGVIQRASGLVNMWETGEGGVLAEGTEAPHPFPMPDPMHLFHLAVPVLYLFIINLWCSKKNVSLSSVSLSSKLIKSKKGAVGISNL